MANIDTTTIIGGPALIFYQGAIFYSQADVVWTNTKRTFPIKTDRFQKVSDRLMDEEIKVTFTPAGEFEQLAVLWPYGTLPLGSRITDAGAPLILFTVAGTNSKRITFHNAAITKMPSIHLSSVKTIMGPVEFTCFLKNNTDPEDPDARWNIADDTTGNTDASFDPDDVITQPYVSSWGADAPWLNFETKDGWTIDFTMALEKIHTDSLGEVSQRLNNLEVHAKCTPIGFSETQLLSELLLQDAGAVRGRTLDGDDLAIDGHFDNVFVRIYRAALTTSPMHFAANLDRIGELTWMANRKKEGASFRPLFYIGASPPT